MKQIPKIVITLEGGIIQNIDSDLPVRIIILDFDNDVVDDQDEKITNFTSLDGEKQKAVVSIWNEKANTKYPEVSKHIFGQLD